MTYRQDGRTRTADAEFCVSTLPPHLLARVPHNLGAAVQAALRAFPPVPAGKIGLEYRSRWWETDLGIYGGSTETGRPGRTHPRREVPGRAGLVVLGVLAADAVPGGRRGDAAVGFRGVRAAAATGRRVYFAGDWLSHAVAWQHGAFVAARAAVTALHRRVLAG